MRVIAAKAVALKEAMSDAFTQYQARVLANARAMADALQQRGLRIVSGRTESHLFLLDLRAKGITGKDAEAALGRARITVNKNTIPNDPQKPFVASGIRIGSPAITTRGFDEDDSRLLAGLVADVLDSGENEKIVRRVGTEIKALTSRKPVYAR